MLLIIGHHLSLHGIGHILNSNKNRVKQWKKGNNINKLIYISLIPGGNIGVGIFFMISGYLILIKIK